MRALGSMLLASAESAGAKPARCLQKKGHKHATRGQPLHTAHDAASITLTSAMGVGIAERHAPHTSTPHPTPLPCTDACSHETQTPTTYSLAHSANSTAHAALVVAAEGTHQSPATCPATAAQDHAQCACTALLPTSLSLTSLSLTLSWLCLTLT